MTDSLASIIVPCHDRSALLADCLQSIASQSYPNLELIVVDDASSEDIEQVISDVRWIRPITVEYVRLTTNVGPGGAREAGRQRATGDFICYLDSDDFMAAEFVEMQVQNLRANPAAGMSYCISRGFSALPMTGNERIRKLRPVKTVLPYPLFRRPWETSSIMWTRAAMETVGSWSSLRFGEDTEYEIRAGCLGVEVVFLPRPLLYIREYTSSERASAPSIDKLRMEIEFTRQIIATIVQHNRQTDRSVAEFCALALFRMLGGPVRVNQRPVARSYLRTILDLCSYSPALKMIAVSHLLLLDSLPTPILVRVFRLTKRPVTRFIVGRWRHLFEGWNSLGM